jgi:oligo-1,6-glucosidase/alpha-glucosidase
LAAVIAAYEAALPAGAWPNWVIGSHDAPRIAARLGEAQARVAAMLLLTLRGTPTLYQGDEIGIGEVRIPIDRIRDPREQREPGLGLGRDRSRTPIPWDGSAYAGFSTAEPWLPLGEDWRTRNIAAQAADPASMLNLYRALLAARRASPALEVGSFALAASAPDVLAYERREGDERLLIALNLGDQPQRLLLSPGVIATEVLLSTLAGPVAASGGWLRAHEGLVIGLTMTGGA